MIHRRSSRVLIGTALAIAASVAPMRLVAQRGTPLGAPPGTQKTKQDVLIPMRDGVELAADLYVPSGAGPSAAHASAIILPVVPNAPTP